MEEGPACETLDLPYPTFPNSSCDPCRYGYGERVQQDESFADLILQRVAVLQYSSLADIIAKIPELQASIPELANISSEPQPHTSAATPFQHEIHRTARLLCIPSSHQAQQSRRWSKCFRYYFLLSRSVKQPFSPSGQNKPASVTSSHEESHQLLNPKLSAPVQLEHSADYTVIEMPGVLPLYSPKSGWLSLTISVRSLHLSQAVADS